MKKLILTLLMVIVSTGYISAQDNAVPEAPMGLSPLEAYSVFNSFYNNKDYTSALEFGRYLITAHPKHIEMPGNAVYRGDRTFDRMITVYTELATAEVNPTIKSALLDTASSLYAKVLETFTDEEIDRYRWTFNYGRFLQTHTEIADNNTLAAEQYMKLYEMDQKQMVESADGYYIQFIVSHLVGTGERDKAIEVMDAAEQYANQDIKDYFNSVRDRLFSNPQERIEFLLTRGDSPEILNELFDLYKRVGDTAKMTEMTQTLYDKDPNFANTLRMATLVGGNGQYRDAIRFLEEAVTKTQDKIQLRDAYMEISNNYLNLDNLPRAREFARKSSDQDPSWGQPFLKLAEIYGQAVSNCARSEMTRQDKVVYYLVLDYMDRARRVDSSTASFVNRQYSVYVNAAPTVEDKFYQGWNTGDSIRVDGSLKECYSWVGETTTVR
ncbi:MAG TPA: hypothetical protein DCE78_05235 [Bacteroidetes bacterium]|nr:hypothetical protein [Bacteroidota bacterium]